MPSQRVKRMVSVEDTSTTPAASGPAPAIWEALILKPRKITATRSMRLAAKPMPASADGGSLTVLLRATPMIMARTSGLTGIVPWKRGRPPSVRAMRVRAATRKRPGTMFLTVLII
jgi:hypothetical protein